MDNLIKYGEEFLNIDKSIKQGCHKISMNTGLDCGFMHTINYNTLLRFSNLDKSLFIDTTGFYAAIIHLDNKILFLELEYYNTYPYKPSRKIVNRIHTRLYERIKNYSSQNISILKN